MSYSEETSVLNAFGWDWGCVPTLDWKEELALEKALTLVLSQVPQLKSTVVMFLFEKDNINLDVWSQYEHFTRGDVVNLIWQFQETIHEAIVQVLWTNLLEENL